MFFQNPFRFFILLTTIVSLSKLSIAQSSSVDVAYSERIDAVVKFTTGYNSAETTVSSKSLFDYSQGVSLPHFDALEEYVSQNLLYPELAILNAVEGTVKLSLKLSSTGKVISASVIESLGYGCDQAAIGLALNMPNWKPAHNYGMAVGSKQLVAIEFKLQ